MTTKMQVGWLWLDTATDTTVEEKIVYAAKRYAEKFGHKPDTCYVNPKAGAGNGDVQVDGMVVETARHILPHHFWLGVRDGKEETKSVPVR